jgi:hypothetical protein
MNTSENASREHDIVENIREQAKTISVMSEILLPLEDLDYLRSNIRSIIMKGLLKDTEDEKILAAFMLVDIGIRRYDDGAFWPQIEAETGITLNDAGDQKGLYLTFMDALGYLGLNSGPETKRKYVDRILMHTFVPDAYLNGFYDFVCKTYKTILDYSVDDLDSYSERLSNFLQLFDGGSIKDLDPDMPHPASLRVCTRYALSDPEFSGPILEKIVRMIDAGYKGESYNDETLNRFADSFRDWYKRNIGMRSKRSLQEEIRNRRPCLVFDNKRYLVSIRVPIQRSRSPAQLRIKTRTGIIEVDQPTAIQHPKTKEYMMLEKKYELGKLNISPFQWFEVLFDNKIIYANKNTKNEHIFFGESGTETKNLSEGINYLIQKEGSKAPKNISGCEIEQLKGGVYVIGASPNGRIDISGKLFEVREEDLDTDSINISAIKNVFAETSAGDFLPITDQGVLSFIVNTGGKRVLPVIMIKNRNEWRHVPIQPEDQSISDSTSAFTYELSDDTGPQEYEVVLKLDEKTLCKARFILIPGFKHKFDTALQYDDRMSGTLNVSLKEQPISFSTGQDEVSHSFLIGDICYKMIYRIPVLSISVKDDEWRYPGHFDITKEEMVNDSIKIRSPSAYLMRLNVKNGKTKMDLIDKKDDVFTFRAIGLKNVMKNSPEDEYALELSVNSKPRKRLMRIYTCNDYEISDSNGIVITMKRNIDSESTYKLFLKKKCIASGTITEGVNPIPVEIKEGVTVSVFETPPSSLTDRDERLILERCFGDPVDSERTKDGYIIYFGDENPLNLMCDTGNYNDVVNVLNRVKKFNPWVNNNEKQILKHLKERYGL